MAERTVWQDAQEGPPPPNSKLVYAAEGWAFFTTARVDEVYGDDWDDAPYEHNAGDPYLDRWPIWIVAVETALALPDSGLRNSPWSVEDINAGKVPWFRPDPFASGIQGVSIYAGCSYAAFVELVGAAGGRIYEPRAADDRLDGQPIGDVAPSKLGGTDG